MRFVLPFIVVLFVLLVGILSLFFILCVYRLLEIICYGKEDKDGDRKNFDTCDEKKRF